MCFYLWLNHAACKIASMCTALCFDRQLFLQPPRLCRISCSYLVDGKYFPKKKQLHKTRGLISSATVCLQLLFLTQEVFREVPQVEVCLHVVLTKTEFRRQIWLKIPNITFHENLLSGSHGMSKLIPALRIFFADLPKKGSRRCEHHDRQMWKYLAIIYITTRGKAHVLNLSVCSYW